jgi:molybdopterin/thiamine biosynthesis adenylyltransferase
VDHTRHLDLFQADSLSISLIGCGGIGAITALVLAKMGVGYLTLYDADEVDAVNLATQFHLLSDVGRPKVYSLAETIALFSDDTTIEAYHEVVDRDTSLYGQIIISAVDSISARKEIWEAVKNSNAQWYLDSRMAAEEFRLYAIDRRQEVSWYENLLAGEDDDTALQEMCTAKATMFCASAASAHIGAAVKGILVGEPPARILTHNIRREVLFTL